MFDSPVFPKQLDEEMFQNWLEKGRSSKLSYNYLLIIWSELDKDYVPVYTQNRDEIDKYQLYGESYTSESLIAAYDLFSESRI
ncbi:MAG: hypothetical protein AAF843_11105 [Bacteroidota bacterium]